MVRIHVGQPRVFQKISVFQRGFRHTLVLAFERLPPRSEWYRSPGKSLAREADATEFWSLKPDTVKSEVVQFPSKVAA